MWSWVADRWGPALGVATARLRLGLRGDGLRCAAREKEMGLSEREREEERRASWMGLWWCALLATGEDQRGGVESFTTRVKRRRRGARAKQREHHVRKRPFSELLFEGFCS